MIARVYARAVDSGLFQRVVVATDDARIAECVTRFSGEVEFTRADHVSGTQRVAEVAERYPDFPVVVNLQGDQPFVTGEILSVLVAPYRAGESPDMTTVAAPLDPGDRDDPHTVKVVCARDMRALLFTRAAVPYFREVGDVPVFKHIGVYGFRRNFLLEYSRLSETPLERCESLEQLRALEHGYTIRVGLVPESPPEINTLEDLAKSGAWIAELERSEGMS
jgi:3-deoxy-manno-octulosonate cytidylyltransferase (CMP-KDO synthetase)